MKLFKRKDMEAMRAKLNIVDTIGADIVLRKDEEDGLHKGTCLFCYAEEMQPTLQMKSGTDLYDCSRCGATGDSVTYLMTSRHMSFPDAIEALMKQCNISYEDAI